MAASENPLYTLPSSPFAETLWTNWNAQGSPVSNQDDGNFEMESNWPSPIYPAPDYYSLPLDKWPDQSTTSLSNFSSTGYSLSTEQLPSGRVDIMGWTPTLDTFSAPVFSAIPIASPDLTLQCNPLQDCSNPPSTTTTPSNHSSPSDSNSSPPSSIPSSHSDTKTNRGTKAPIRCWEHSCGGRAFSSLGNYERHLREKSGRAKSFTCEQCGQRFTRSTAKNKHIRYGRCRMRQVR
ncbi:hypothetical protein BDW62DRAFT_203309 [Aspergillus aurantiobrunneus]